MGWQFSTTDRQYSDTSTGEVVSSAELKGLQADFIGQMQTQMSDKARELINRGASPDEFEAGLRPLIDHTQAISYQLSVGGSNAMTDADWAAVSDLINQQYTYLNAFAQDAGTGQISEDDAAKRAALYAESGHAAASQGTAATWGLDLPVYPPIHPSCACSWVFEDGDNGPVAYFQTDADPCPECSALADEYRPFVP